MEGVASVVVTFFCDFAFNVLNQSVVYFFIENSIDKIIPHLFISSYFYSCCCYCCYCWWWLWNSLLVIVVINVSHCRHQLYILLISPIGSIHCSCTSIISDKQQKGCCCSWGHSITVLLTVTLYDLFYLLFLLSVSCVLCLVPRFLLEWNTMLAQSKYCPTVDIKL